MAHLLIGPLLRYVSRDSATIWVETDEPCEVRILDTTTPTFSVWGHHYALVILQGLEQAACIPYTVSLDGVQRWPEFGSRFPQSAIRTIGDDGAIRVLFGSCRAAAPHEAPFDLETALREEGAEFEATDPWQPKLVVDGRLITGQNPASGGLVGAAVAKALLK